MKLNIVFYLILLINLQSFAQEKNTEKIISDIFFGFDLSKKPIQIEKEYRGLIDTGVEMKKEQNIKSFDSHPFIDNFPRNHSKFTNGYFNVLYAFDDEELFNKYGVYVLKLTMDYENGFDSKRFYDLLVSKFEDFGCKMFVNNTMDNHNIIINNETIFQKEKDIQIPRLELQYNTFEDEHNPDNKKTSYRITILYTNSWDLKRLKKYDGKFY